MKTKPTERRSGFSMLDFFLIIAALAGILIVVLPEIARRGARSSRISCTNNLKQVGLVFRIWAGDNNDKMPMQVSVTNGGAIELANEGSAYAVFMVMSNELVTPKILICPDESNRKRRMATIFAPTAPPNANQWTIPFTATNNLSYFVGLDASEIQPSAILAGDDHFLVSGVKPKPGLLMLQTNASVEWRNERHPKQGNVAIADASVQSLTTPAFRATLVQTGIATNRLAMP